MLTRSLLIISPLIILAVLFQSVLWVPGYSELSKADADGAATSETASIRRSSFVEASIADAKILNPILNADTASSRIVDLVFDGLLGLDSDLNIETEMAESYTLSEWVYLAVPKAHVDTAEQALRDLLAASASLRSIVRGISWEPSSTREISLPQEDADPVVVSLKIEPRLKFELSQVTPDLQQQLADSGYKHVASTTDYLSWSDAVDKNSDKQTRHAQILELAESEVPAVEHNPIIDFHLKPDIRFHDGHVFDADDVRFTYEAIMNPANLSPRTSNFEPVKSVEVVNAAHVRVVYKRLFSPAVLAWTMPILPEHLLNDAQMEKLKAKSGRAADQPFAMRDVDFNRNPIGTGPYQFVSWQTDDSIKLEANTEYYGVVPELSRFAYRVLPDNLVQELEVNAGAIDIYQPQPYQVERYVDDDRFNTVSMPGSGYSYIAYNLRRPRFADARVRTALSMAINIDEIVRFVLFGEGEQTSGPYPMNTPWYDPEVEPIAWDPDGAEALLNEAGWQKNADGWMEKDGEILSFTLITNQGNAVREAILSIAQDAWRRIGVRCDTQIFEWAVFLEDFVNKGDYDALVLGWSMGADPDLYQLWHSSQTDYAELNFTGYKNADVDRIIESIRQQYDFEEQKKLAHELHAIIARDQPYTFLFAPRSTRVLNKSLRMRREDGEMGAIEAVPSGAIYQHFDRWTRPGLSPNS